ETAPAIAECLPTAWTRPLWCRMTLLLPVRWTGSTRNRSERHPDRFPLDDSRSHARSRRTETRGNQLPDESSAWKFARRRRAACGAARDAGSPAPCGGAGHVRRTAFCVARIDGESAQRLQRYSATTDRRAHDEEAVAVGESLQRSHSGTGRGP